MGRILAREYQVMQDRLRGFAKRIMFPWLSRRARRRAISEQEILFEGIHVVIYPEVFHPFETPSTLILYEFLKTKSFDNQALLELGAGSGLLSFLMAAKGAIVTASDINPHAVAGIKKNSSKNGLSVQYVESDLFDNLRDRHFDCILINPPFYAKNPESWWQYSYYAGADLSYFRRLYKNLGHHLRPGGQAYMILSRDLDQAQIFRGLDDAKLAFDYVYARRKWFEWFDIVRISSTS